MGNYGTDVADYAASYDASMELFRDAMNVAEKVGGTLGLTAIGRLVITLPAGVTAQEAAATISGEDFPHCYIEPGTDSVLVFAF